MKITIEITLPPVPYGHDISDLAGYLQMVGGELTGARVFVNVNDYDFTDKVSVFKQMRKPSHIHQQINSIPSGGSASAIQQAASTGANYAAVAPAYGGFGSSVRQSLQGVRN